MGQLLRQSVSYKDAQTRGRLRAWKAQLAENYIQFDNAFRYLDPRSRQSELVADMALKSSAGSDKAFRKIQTLLGPGVRLEHRRCRRKRTFAIWSILKPRSAVACAVSKSDYSAAERASFAQDCVTVDYVLIGAIRKDIAYIATGLWTLEVPDHALGRAVERSRLRDPGELIREAHLNLLDLPETLSPRVGADRGTYFKAGSGCFAGRLSIWPDVSTGELVASVRVNTWLNEDQLFDDQIVLSQKGEAGQRLGDGWFLPQPLRRLVRDGNEVHCCVLDAKTEVLCPAARID
jgi:hypothetical protein